MDLSEQHDDTHEGATVQLTDAARSELERFRLSHETKVLTILLSDLEGSTKQQSTLGNVRAAELVREHRTLFRNQLSGYDGQEVETAGDSFLAVFAAPSEGVKFAVHLQAAMRDAIECNPDLPAVRVGLHQGQVVLERHDEGPKALDIYGLQVSTAARIMDLGKGGQILCSRAVFDDARTILRRDDFESLSPVAWRNHGPYRFKGVEDSYDVCEVGEESFAPMSPPPASTKSWPADQAEEELGWRPAAGATVPETNWHLVERLGREEGGKGFKGEFGEVWKAFNPSDKSHQVFKFCFRRDRVPALKREARLLKRLKKYAHPNLVEVYDVTEGERPPHYLEMEYVAGPSLEEWLAVNPPLKDRLEVVAQIADALDTVHAAGIYHRDIKPSNILLTYREDGSLLAKLSDFGLGAADDAELLKSIMASRVEGVAGTWDYIAPELREGNNASPQSDIYSLGLTLYQILVGDPQRPLTADWATQIDSEIAHEDIANCIAREPSKRWARASELATALRSHDQRLRERELEREREEQRKRAQRLRRLTAVLSAFIVVTLGFGGVAAYQWREAERQKERAVRQKEMALTAIGKLTHDVPQQLNSIPGTLTILRPLMEDNMRMLDEILALEPDTLDAKRDRAVNQSQIGDVWELLGDLESAKDAYDKAMELILALVEEYPDDEVLKRDLSITYERLGNAYGAMGRIDDALDAHEKGMEIAREFAKNHPDVPGAKRDLVLGYGDLGTTYMNLGRTQDAFDAFSEANRLAVELVDLKFPDERTAKRDLSVTYESLGDFYLRQGDVDKALENHRAGLEIAEVLAKETPNDLTATRDLGLGHEKLADALSASGFREQAVDEYRVALRMTQEAADADPNNQLSRRDLAITHTKLGDLLTYMKRDEDALHEFELARSLYNEQLARDPHNQNAMRDVTVGYDRIGNVYMYMQRFDEALEAYRTAETYRNSLLENDPSNVESKRDVVVSCNKMGDVLLALGRYDEVAARYTQGFELTKELVDADPQNFQYQLDLGISYYKMTLFHGGYGDVDRWHELVPRCIEQYEKAYALAPDMPMAANSLMTALHNISWGLLNWDGRTPEDAKLAVTYAKRLTDLASHNDPYAMLLLADAYFASGDAANAVKTIDEASTLLPPGDDADEATAEIRRNIAARRAAFAGQ